MAGPYMDTDSETGPGEGGAGEDLEEIQEIATRAFPGVDIDAGAIKELIQHCIRTYGEETDMHGGDMPLSKKPMLEVVMGLGKKK